MKDIVFILERNVFKVDLFAEILQLVLLVDISNLAY